MADADIVEQHSVPKLPDQPPAPPPPTQTPVETPPATATNGTPALPPVPETPKDDGRLPSTLWVKADQRVKAEVIVYKKIRTGEMAFVTMPSGRIKQSDIDILELAEFPIEFTFSMPTQKQLASYREQCSVWNVRANDFVLGRAKMRRLLRRYHLLATNLPDPAGDGLQKWELKREKGKLSEATEETLANLHPTVIDLLMVRFELEANITY